MLWILDGVIFALVRIFFASLGSSDLMLASGLMVMVPKDLLSCFKLDLVSDLLMFNDFKLEEGLRL